MVLQIRNKVRIEVSLVPRPLWGCFLPLEWHGYEARKEVYRGLLDVSFYMFGKEEILHIRLVRGAGGHGHDEPCCKSLL